MTQLTLTTGPNWETPISGYEHFKQHGIDSCIQAPPNYSDAYPIEIQFKAPKGCVALQIGYLLRDTPGSEICRRIDKIDRSKGREVSLHMLNWGGDFYLHVFVLKSETAGLNIPVSVTTATFANQPMQDYVYYSQANISSDKETTTDAAMENPATVAIDLPDDDEVIGVQLDFPDLRGKGTLLEATVVGKRIVATFALWGKADFPLTAYIRRNPPPEEPGCLIL